MDQFRKVWPEKTSRETMKWTNVKKPKHKQKVIALLKSVIDLVVREKLRVNTLIWYSEDWRNEIPHYEKRDDEKNLQFMYRFLFRDLIYQRRGLAGDLENPITTKWGLNLDRQRGIDFGRLGRDLCYYKSEWYGEKLNVQVIEAASLEKGEVVDKNELDPSIMMVQVADIFAGMGAYSHQYFREYSDWEKQDSGLQLPLKLPGLIAANLSCAPSYEARFPIMSEFHRLCCECNLEVSLHRGEGFWTPNPNYPINFWVYHPRHSDSRVPTRPRKR